MLTQHITPTPTLTFGKLRATLASILLAALLSLGSGLAVLGAVAATAGVAAGSLGVAHDACQQVEEDLAGALGTNPAALRALPPATVSAQLAARRDAGALTVTEARRAESRVAAYAGCRDLFAPPTE